MGIAAITRRGAQNANASQTPPASLVGAQSLGTTSYEIPSSAVIFVSPTGNDSNPGTIGSPKQTIIAASNAIRSSGTVTAPATVVIRGGVYHEGMYNPGNGYYMRWQAYPGEVVWLDGSSQITASWTNNGNGTWTTAYTPYIIPGLGDDVLEFDLYAHYPDMVFVNDVQLKQIADNTTPSGQEFSVNRAANSLTIATNPSGKEIRVSDLTYLHYSGSRIDILGIGMRRYSCSGDGKVLLYLGGTTQNTIYENCIFTQMGRSVIAMSKANMRISHCTFSDINQVAIGGTRCDDAIVENNYIVDTNQGRWKPQPQTGALKITAAQRLIIRYNRIERSPRGNLIWLDVSCTRAAIYGNYLDGLSPDKYASTGICYEECDGGFWDGVQYYSYIVGNTVLNCGAAIVVGAAGHVVIANNTVRSEIVDSGNNRGIVAVQDRDTNHGQQVPIANCHWWCTGISVLNNRFIPNSRGIQMMAYDTQGEVETPGRSRAISYGLGDTDLAQCIGGNMFDRVQGNWFAPATGLEQSGSIMVSLSRAIGGRKNTNDTAGLTTFDAEYGYGTHFAGNYQSAVEPSSPSDHATAVAADGTWAPMLGMPIGSKYIGNPHPMPLIL